MIEACPANLECEVVHTFSLGQMTVFVGEIKNAYVDDCIPGDPRRPGSYGDLVAIDPLIYGPDNGYYRIGARVGTGFHEGTSLGDVPTIQGKKGELQT